MYMRPRRAAGRAYIANDVALANTRAFLISTKFIEMSIFSFEATLVLNDDQIAKRAFAARERHTTVAGRTNWRARWCSVISAFVRANGV